MMVHGFGDGDTAVEPEDERGANRHDSPQYKERKAGTGSRGLSPFRFAARSLAVAERKVNREQHSGRRVPGEKVYENAWVHELGKSGFRADQQHEIAVRYDGIIVAERPESTSNG